jgi:hypothetical protein
MRLLLDVLLFRRMLAPVLLQLLFWAAIGGTIYGALWLYRHDSAVWWVALVCGTLMCRILFEFGIIAFRSYEALCAVRDSLADQRE